MLRLIDKAIDWRFIYDLVEDKYSKEIERPSIDPVTLIKIPMIQYLYGIKSMRQTIKEIEVNVAYRWFLGLDMFDTVPHFSTFGKNYTRRFKDTDLFEQIFGRILEDCMKFRLVDTSIIFVDSTHVKACANSKKMRNRIAKQEALWYKSALQEEITKERVKTIIKHVWDDYLEIAEDIRYTIGNRAIYQQRKETIERIFGSAKEHHGFRYTNYVGKARIEMKVELTFACMNLKKLAKMLATREAKFPIPIYSLIKLEFLSTLYGFKVKYS